MKNSDEETKMESYRKREVARVQKGRQKRRKELERLRRFYKYIEKTDPKKIHDFDNAESSTIVLQENTNTITLQDNITPQDNTSTLQDNTPQDNTNTFDLLEEMCRTYHVDTFTLQDTITLQDNINTITPQDNTSTLQDNITPQDNTSTLQDNTNTFDLLEEMCQTYSVHLEEFDHILFEGLYDEHPKI